MYSILDRIDWLTRSIARRSARTRCALIHVPQIRPNHYVQFSDQIEYSSQERSISSKDFPRPELLPSYPFPLFLSRVVRLARDIYEVVISRNDLDRRESSAPPLLGWPPVARSVAPRRKVTWLLQSDLSQVGIMDVSRNSLFKQTVTRGFSPV